jgi:hypothetical protein
LAEDEKRECGKHMSLVSIFLSIVVFVLSFYGLGFALGGWRSSSSRVRKLTGFWSRLDGVISTIVTSFIIAVVVVWLLKLAGIIQVQGMRGLSWGIYTVSGSLSTNALVALGISLAFIIILIFRILITVPAFAKLAIRLLGESEWLDEFMIWAMERRKATILGAMWILSKLQGLFKW